MGVAVIRYNETLLECIYILTREISTNGTVSINYVDVWNVKNSCFREIYKDSQAISINKHELNFSSKLQLHGVSGAF